MADRQADPATSPAAAVAADGVAADTTATGVGRLDLVRAVVEQIVGQALSANEIDAIADAVQPVAVAFDRARQVQAAQERAAKNGERISWSATLDLRETHSGEGTFAVSGALKTADGREVALEVRVLGDGDAAVLPLRLDVDVNAEGLATRLVFAGRAVSDDGTPGSGVAATAAAWAGLPVRVNAPDGGMRITTLGDARAAALGPGVGGGGHHIDLVA